MKGLIIPRGFTFIEVIFKLFLKLYSYRNFVFIIPEEYKNGQNWVIFEGRHLWLILVLIVDFVQRKVFFLKI